MIKRLTERMFANTAFYTLNPLSLVAVQAKNTSQHNRIIARVLLTAITDCTGVFVYLDVEGRDWPSETTSSSFYKIPGAGGASPGPAGTVSEFFPAVRWKQDETLNIYLRNEGIQKAVFQMSLEGILEIISHEDVV